MSNAAITKLTAVILVVIVIVAGSAGAYYYYSSSQKPKVQQVNILLTEPLTGPLASFGTQCRDGAILAADDINEGGGIKSLGGAKINLIISDNKGDPSVAAAETQRVISSNKISAVVGSYGSAVSLAFTEVTERAKIPTVGVAGSVAIYNRGFKYVFLIGETSPFWGYAQADYALALSKALGFSLAKIAIVHEDGAFGSPMAASAVERATAKGLQVVLKEPYRAATLTDATAIALKIKTSGAQLLLLTGYVTDESVILKAMAGQGLTLPVIGAGGLADPTFLDVAGPIAMYMFTLEQFNWDVKDPVGQAAAKKYEARFNKPMFATAGGVYANVWVVKEALEKAASDDPQLVRDAIATLDVRSPSPAAATIPGHHIKFVTDGTLGNIYDGSGDTYMILLQWGKDRLLRTVLPVADATSSPVWPPPS